MNLSVRSERRTRETAQRRQRPIAALLLCFLAAIPASAQQLTARFYPQKSVYLLGEPIWLVFEVTNTGRVPVYIEYANPYGVCAFLFGYAFDVPRAQAVGNGCGGYIASCSGGGSRRLAPGAAYTQRLLLNQWFHIDHPGEYRVSASRALRFSLHTQRFKMLLNPRSRTFKSQLDFDLVQSDEAHVAKVYEPFLRNLSSGDFDLRTEGIETITTMAPPFLEKTLIALAESGDSYAMGRAIPALGRLNTRESRRILAKLIEARRTGYSGQAVDALARTGDRSYIPLLEKLAMDPAWQNVAIPALGELGGETVVPLLASFLHYPHGQLNGTSLPELALSGLANTASRKAVPYLIEALRDPWTHHDAVSGLEQLTHLVIHQGRSQGSLYADDPKTAAAMANRWQHWWKSMGRQAALYGPADCTNSPGELPQ